MTTTPGDDDLLTLWDLYDPEIEEYEEPYDIVDDDELFSKWDCE